ncbi:MAG TPA: J domain-containing protein [Hellea balneolensis]|uniref:J domain-containing protein n=1 Tax=Hellea balneolensis TaxID=287478 RepID=A0A7C5R7F0_9PROT|nr:J domain-containing protein [Hellea balneolensis]
MVKDPYKILGVKRTADEKEIKKAYRQLAKKLHPDVNPDDEKAQERFKEVSAAYTLLSDKDLRAQYDSGQIDGSGQQQNPFAGRGGFQNADFGEHAEMADIFSTLFGMNMGGGPRTGHPFTRSRAHPMPRRGADVRYELEIPMIEAITGASKQIRMSDGKSLKLNIPEGIEDGTTLRLRGKGESGIGGGPPGDAKIKIKIKPHKLLRRDGKNLRMDLPISLKEAVLGAKIKVPTPHGAVNLKIAPGTSSGKTLRLKGKGIKGGDLLARLQIILPEKISQDLKTCVKSWDDEPDPRAKLRF